MTVASKLVRRFVLAVGRRETGGVSKKASVREQRSGGGGASPSRTVSAVEQSGVYFDMLFVLHQARLDKDCTDAVHGPL